LIYREALERLLRLQRFGVRPGLDGVKRALTVLGEPQRKLRVVHVAGTNGKGSTAAFLESLFRAAGLRTGLYTSPHLLRFTERIRIDGREIDEERIADFTERLLTSLPEVTFFEAATAMALAAFRQDGVDVAVLEAGLGGRLDATNVFADPLATVVTGIALDHTDVLGPTLAKIAYEKAGIFKRGAPAVFACADPEARAVLQAEAGRAGAPAYMLGRDLHARARGESLIYDGPGGPVEAALGLDGEHQLGNAALALAAAALACDRLGRPLTARAKGLREVKWPARLERVAPDVLVDAAHNPDGARALAAALPSLSAGRPIALVFGAVADKDAREMLVILRRVVGRVVLTRPPSPRAIPPEELVGWAPGAVVCDSPEAALAEARDGGALVVVAGSIFLAGEARRLITGEPVDPIRAQDPGPKVAGTPIRGL
jgi:dihydrofolate synthase/folylpolyglutamate synthase